MDRNIEQATHLLTSDSSGVEIETFDGRVHQLPPAVVHRKGDCVAAGGRTHLAEDCFSSGPWPPQQPCAAKVGEPFHMRECGEPVEYRAAGETDLYSGWYHVDRALDARLGHHGVPRQMVR